MVSQLPARTKGSIPSIPKQQISAQRSYGIGEDEEVLMKGSLTRIEAGRTRGPAPEFGLLWAEPSVTRVLFLFSCFHFCGVDRERERETEREREREKANKRGGEREERE